MSPSLRRADEQRVAAVAAFLLASFGVATLAGWLTGALVLASADASFIPMAPSTGIAFVVLGVALVMLARGRAAARFVIVASSLVAIAGVVRLVTLALHLGPLADLEAALVPNAGLFGQVPLARMSPVTAASLAGAGVAVALLATAPRGLRRDVAGALGTAVAATGSTVLLGYAYGTPLLYGGAIIPVALPTAIGLVLAGAAIVGVASRDAAPLRAFMSSGARARLLRSFLPATTAAVLVASAATQVLVRGFGANPALAGAIATLAATAVVTALVWRIAGSVGGAIDRAEETETRARLDLEAAVASRTAELARINEELEAFASSVSHDLRAPLRHMTGFAALLERSAGDALSDTSRGYVRRILEGGARMTRLIDDLLAFARTAQTRPRVADVDLSALVREVVAEASRDAGGRVIEWQIDPLPVVRADVALLRQAVANLVGNAVKYTRTRQAARIEIGAARGDVEDVLFVRDNGVGFDMQYRDKLFGVFQRLHGGDEFEGTGIGLANVRRIVQRHGGRVWAEGMPERGATFYIALPEKEITR